MKCDITSCTPQFVLTILLVFGMNIFIWFLIYLYIMYDTYVNYSSDLINWKNEQIQQINNLQYKPQYTS